jgi:hypothetical protein
MARVDYYALEEEIKVILDADPTVGVAGVPVRVEESVMFAAESTPAVYIYLDRRDAPAELQTLRAGSSTDFALRFSLWVWAYSLDGVKIASQIRDDLMGKVEVALMGNRTLNDKVRTSWIEGGEFMSAKEQEGWMMGGEIVLVARAQATT